MKSPSPPRPGLFTAPPVYQAICGLLVLPVFLLQTDVAIRCFQTAGFVLMAKASGRKINMLSSLFLLAGILIMNLLSPHGEVIARVFTLPVTLGALRMGLHRATTFIGLIYLSRYTISPGLRLPGKAGGVLGKTFCYFEYLQEENARCDEKNVFRRIDAVLSAVSSRIAEQGDAYETAGVASCHVTGLLLMCLFTGINWGAFIFSLLYRH
ncbi:MAG: hypothetical protein JW881_15165 [Spirochaetales bacterium]|nr:hypothetical protein [Spirochaetales bacterium]